MKLLGFVPAIALLFFAFASAPAMAQSDSLPNTGTYFVTSTLSDQALQPAAPSLGQNVLLYDYNKGGTQLWQFTRLMDLRTEQPTNRYTIRLAGENSELNFQPHPSIADAGAILGTNKPVYVLEPGEAGFAIKSVDRNGDAMFVYAQPPLNAEVHFGADDGSKKFRWNILGTAPVFSDPLPNTGTYFITNASGEQALQPGASSMGQTVFLYDFNRGGSQKWQITRRIDLQTQRPTNRYTIRLAGDAEDLNFQPHPSVSDAGAILGTDKAVYVLQPGNDGIAIQSVANNGDALFAYPQPPANAEARFGPDDGSRKFRWNFVPAF